MKTLCIAIGNEMRGDDGVAHFVAGRLRGAPDVTVLDVFQLTPELATEVARAETVIFIDADIDAPYSYLEPIAPQAGRTAPIGHTMSPAEVVRLAASLYGFFGQAHLCGIPASVFEGEGLSSTARSGAESALELLGALVRIQEHASAACLKR